MFFLFPGYPVVKGDIVNDEIAVCFLFRPEAEVYLTDDSRVIAHRLRHVRQRNHHLMPLAIQKVRTVFQDMYLCSMMFQRVQNIAIAEQLNFKIAGGSFGFDPEGQIGHLTGVGADIGSRFPVKPVKTTANPDMTGMKLELKRRVAAMGISGHRSECRTRGIGPPASDVGLFAIPDNDPTCW